MFQVHVNLILMWIFQCVSGTCQPHDDGSTYAGGTAVRPESGQPVHDIVAASHWT